MTKEIIYKDIPALLAEVSKGKVVPIYLLYGDEFLCKSAFKSLLNAIVSPDNQVLNYEVIDGTSENIYETIERLNTFPLIPSDKVIAVYGTRIFYSAVAIDDLISKSRDSFEKQDLKGSARYLLQMLSVYGMSLDDVIDGNWRQVTDKKLRESFNKHSGETWLDQGFAYCVQEKLTVPTYQDDAEVLNDSILTGYPKTNHLVLITDFIDKRRKLYKTIKKTGVVIDCSLPKGERIADKRQLQDALKAHMKEVLIKSGKTMAPGGFEALLEKIGPNMRGFSNELDKLIVYMGDRKEIFPSDIEAISKRTKQDPIYEMTNAIAERDTHRALFFLDSLLKNNFFPLQVLAAVTNQIRKLILAKDVIKGSHGIGWKQDISYAAFQKKILPELEKRESDFLTSNVHPFAIYMTLKQSDNYSFEDLISALEVLLDADLRLKRSGQDAKIVLEQAILRIQAD